MEQSPTIGKLAEALAKAQGEMRNAKKEAENPFFHSRYADLSTVIDTVRPALAKNALAVSQLVEPSAERTEVTTILMHSSGEFIRSTIGLTPVKNDPQGVGSAVTYARRYALSAILGIASEEDDDGEAATHPQSKPQPKSETKTQKTGGKLVDKAIASIDAAMFVGDLEAIKLKATDYFNTGKLTEEDKAFIFTQCGKKEKEIEERTNG